MRNKATFIIALLIATISSSQNSEFDTYKNGLIYSETTMSKLSYIVDSLNLEYKVCDLDKTYYSKSQTVGHIIRLNEGNIKNAKKDIENQMSFLDFVKKYPKAKIEKNILIVKFLYKDYNEVEKTKYNEVNPNNHYGLSINKSGSLYSLPSYQSWVYDYSKKTNYSSESIEAFYFPNNFKTNPIGSSYARMIGYADCLIDTTAVKYRKDAERGWIAMPENWKDLSIKKKKTILEKLRKTRVVGSCSMDSSPRTHALNIAILSAETVNWEIFLRSHLDIMNDRFDRVSDGSYAWKNRKTYIGELEKLNINVADLILGITLRVENPANNHYYGSIGRIGRALSETKFKEEIENTILLMIQDTSLDDYNRILSYYLFLNYNHNIDDKSIQKNNILKLKDAVSTLPDYLKSNISL